MSVALQGINKTYPDPREKQVVSPSAKLKDMYEVIEEAKRLQRQADQLTPQLVKMIKGRLHTMNPSGFKSSSYHKLLMELKHELDKYDGQLARWKL